MRAFLPVPPTSHPAGKLAFFRVRVIARSLRLLARRRAAAGRLGSMNEAECYARCHGARDTDVRIVKLEPRRPRYETSVSGEQLRRDFERLLDARDPTGESGQRAASA